MQTSEFSGWTRDWDHAAFPEGQLGLCPCCALSWMVLITANWMLSVVQY